MRAKIVFASMTGNDEDMAEILEEGLLDQGILPFVRKRAVVPVAAPKNDAAVIGRLKELASENESVRPSVYGTAGPC